MKDDNGHAAVPDIQERTLDYGVRAVRLYQALQSDRSGAGRVIARQYLRSATSIGANVAEAQGGETRADFIHKYSIALKETRESLYWLRLVERATLLPPQRLSDIIAETREILAVITAIVVNAKRKTADQ